MSFQLVYYSQQDPQWKEDILGFGDPGDTIGYVGCALTSITMLLNGHGLKETPKTLNEKLKAAGGFLSAMLRWEYIGKVYPQVTLKSNIFCETTDAPLAAIDAALAAGQPVVVRVDSSPAPGLQWHYVLVYAREGNDYLMLDPYPYKPGTASKDYLMARYSHGNPLQRSIQQVLIYEVTGSGGPIAVPAGGSAQTPPAPAPISAPASSPAPAPTTSTSSAPLPAGGIYVRPSADVTAFLNLRFSTDTVSTANIIAQIYPGTNMLLLNAADAPKIGMQGQFLRVREPKGKEGYVAAWYVERAPAVTASVNAKPGTLKVQVIATRGAKIYASPTTTSKVLAEEKTGAVLSVIEEDKYASGKAGRSDKWLYVLSSDGKRGYVQASYVRQV